MNWIPVIAETVTASPEAIELAIVAGIVSIIVVMLAAGRRLAQDIGGVRGLVTDDKGRGTGSQIGEVIAVVDVIRDEVAAVRGEMALLRGDIASLRTLAVSTRAAHDDLAAIVGAIQSRQTELANRVEALDARLDLVSK